jgi:pimeloyl-ACP methyl ester carboxylesterase
VVSYDPRGIGRSERTDAAQGSTAEQHADDVQRLISALDAGPVDIFGSSGGAVRVTRALTWPTCLTRPVGTGRRQPH